jgi:hypothetical protein
MIKVGILGKYRRPFSEARFYKKECLGKKIFRNWPPKGLAFFWQLCPSPTHLLL